MLRRAFALLSLLGLALVLLLTGRAVDPSLAQDGTPTATLFPLTPSAFSYLPHLAHNPSPADTQPAASPTATATQPPASSTAPLTSVPISPTATPTQEPVSPTTTTTPTANLTPILPVIFFDNIESGINGWNVMHSGGSLNWQIIDWDAYSQTHSWFLSSQWEISQVFLVTPSIILGHNSVLTFWHRYLLENESTVGFDAALVEISVDEGINWIDLGPQIIQNGYDITVSGLYGSPIAGRRAFSGDSGGWIQTRVDLQAYGGKTVKVRFRQVNDNSYKWDGWWIDDVFIGQINAIPTPLPQATITLNWTTAASLPTERWQLRTIGASNGGIYAVGGATGDGPTFRALNTVDEYNPTVGTWVSKASMPTARPYLGLTEVNSRLYAIGGWNGSTLNSTEEYDLLTNTWTTRSGMPEARWSLGVAAIGTKIYAIGGYPISSAVYEYNTESDTWARAAGISRGRAELAAVVGSNGKLYAVGGVIDSGYRTRTVGTIEEYDPVSRTWRRRANLPTVRSYLGVIATPDGKIYALGGAGHNGAINAVDVYDIASNTWTTASGLPTARYGFGVAMSAGRIYVIGGVNGPSLVEVASLP